MNMQMEPLTQPETESESDSDVANSDSDVEVPEDVPDMKEYIEAKRDLKDLNKTRKELLNKLKRKADEMEDYMQASESKKIILDGMVCEIKSSKSTPWNEKALREHMDEDGKIDIDEFKSQATVIKERMVIKLSI
jgi:hypothetical protein